MQSTWTRGGRPTCAWFAVLPETHDLPPLTTTATSERESKGAIWSLEIRIAGAVTSIDRIRNDPSGPWQNVRIGEAPMLQHMWHTAHEDALAIGIIATMVGIMLWLPFIWVLAAIVRALTNA
jgi:hypothetical protein